MVSIIESMVTDPFAQCLALLAIFVGVIVFLNYTIPRVPIIKELSPLPFYFVLSMILSNFNIIPMSHPMYKPLRDILLFSAVIWLILGTDMRNLRTLIRPKFFYLVTIGCAGAVLGSLVAFFLFKGTIGGLEAAQLSSVSIGVFVGSLMNWVAISDALGMNETLATAALASETIVYVIYVTVIFALAQSRYREQINRWLKPDYDTKKAAEELERKSAELTKQKYQLNHWYIIYSIGIFAAIYAVSLLLEDLVNRVVFIPAVLFATTLAILVGTFTKVHNFPHLDTLGNTALFLMLPVLGATADLVTALSQAPVLILFFAVTCIIQTVVLLLTARLMHIDVVVTAITGVSLIGGVPTGSATAGIYGMEEFIPLGVIIATVGMVIASYLGVYTGYFLSMIV